MKRLDEKRLAANVDAIAAYDLDNHKVFGSAYWVMQEGRTVLQRCYGVTGMESAAPVTESTIFRMASMTKPVTAVAVLLLVERGLLSLSDPVSRYLPEFHDLEIRQVTEEGIRSVGRAQTPITITHLLTHTSGFGSENAKMVEITDGDRATVDSFLAYHLRQGLDFEPGTRQQYSGSAAFDLLVKIIEQITGTDYLTFLQEAVFAPCGMTDTTFVPSAEQWARMMGLHIRVEGRNALAPTRAGCVHFDFPCTHYLGGAGLVSTLQDYARFAAMLLQEGDTPQGRLLRPETVAQMAIPYVPRSIMPGCENWGLGVRVIADETYPCHLPVGSFGWSGAYGTHFWIDPTNRIAAVFMKNSRVDGGSFNESACNFEKAVHAALVE